MMKIFRTISRLFLGIVFILSGFVKGIDPLGTAYKIEDYFMAFGTDWAIPFSLGLSVLLSVSEFTLGVFLLSNIFKKTTAWITALMMFVFTILTLNDAIYNPVPDCGCFGDFIILTNWETFYKNIVIDFFLIFVFITRNSFDSIYKKTTEWYIAILTISIFTLFNSYNINRLPIIDFRDWKVGKNLILKTTQDLEYYLEYTNKETGEIKEYLSPNYPYNDSAWMAEWKYTNMRVVDPNIYPTDVSFYDLNGDDITQDILQDPLYHFLIISYNLEEGNWTSINKIRVLKQDAEKNAYSFSFITASTETDIHHFQKEHQFYADYYQGDDIDLKTIIRSNPGLVVLKNGLIIGKWPATHLPDYQDIIKLQE